MLVESLFVRQVEVGHVPRGVDPLGGLERRSSAARHAAQELDDLRVGLMVVKSCADLESEVEYGARHVCRPGIERGVARAASSRLLIARERALYIKTVLLPLRERIVRETQLAYNAMTVGVFQLLESKREQIQAGRAYVEALRSYWTAQAEVDQLLAGRLPAGWDENRPMVGQVAPGRRNGH